MISIILSLLSYEQIEAGSFTAHSIQHHSQWVEAVFDNLLSLLVSLLLFAWTLNPCQVMLNLMKEHQKLRVSKTVMYNGFCYVGRKLKQSPEVWVAALNFWGMGIFHIWKSSSRGYFVIYKDFEKEVNGNMTWSCVKSFIIWRWFELNPLIIRSCISVNGTGTSIKTFLLLLDIERCGK